MKKRNKILISCFLVVVLLSVFVLSSFADDLYRDPEEVEPGVVDKVKDPNVNKIKSIAAFKSPSRSVSSDFDENGDNTVFTNNERYNISDMPADFSFYKTDNSSSWVSVYIDNDTDITFGITLTGSVLYFMAESSDVANNVYNVGQPVTFFLDPGEWLHINVYNNLQSGGAIVHGVVDGIIDPDPQPPEPFVVLLANVFDFSTSMFSSWSSLFTLIVSSWIFLVPLIMMLLVFFVLAIRKMIKGV